jgi:hypothetical protein
MEHFSFGPLIPQPLSGSAERKNRTGFYGRVVLK